MVRGGFGGGVFNGRIQPVGRVDQRPMDEPDPVFAAANLPADQARALQDAEVLGDRGKRNAIGLGDLGHPCRAGQELVDDGASRRVGDRTINPVERHILNRKV